MCSCRVEDIAIWQWLFLLDGFASLCMQALGVNGLYCKVVLLG
jgi:hypothetical protein